MYFDTPIYFLFLLAVVLVYWRLGFRQQNLFLLAASYFFYGWWDWRFLLLIATSTTLNFMLASRIASHDTGHARKRLLVLSLVVNFSFLGFFKYFNFFVGSFIEIAPMLGLGDLPVVVWQIVLPPAISFYTFQEVAYLVDVYQRRIPACRSLTDYALFVSLFPHLIAGPIQQPSHLLPQVAAERRWNSSTVFDGIMLIIEGLFRKIVIADNCALIANAAFAGNLGGHSAMTVMLGTLAFAFQIYGDFSGYSSMARGSAQVLGFHFMVNFRQPYLADSIQDFWRRWHISLSSWLRDYLYIPLGGNRRGKIRTYANLMTTMLLGGLWHGANWTFVIWGAIHGAALSVERALTGGGEVRAANSFTARLIRRLIVFALVCVAWIFFRSQSVGEAVNLLSMLDVWHWRDEYGIALTFLFVFSSPLVLLDMHLERTGGEYLASNRSFGARIAVGVALMAAAALFGANQTSAFIYFQF